LQEPSTQDKAAISYVVVYGSAVAKVVPFTKDLLLSWKAGAERKMGGHVASQTATAIAVPQGMARYRDNLTTA